jgi:hypothetical protein
LLACRRVEKAEAIANEVRELCGHSGFELPPETVTAMGEHAKTHRKDPHGKHEYTLEMYGLTAAMVRDRLATYIERFGLAAC